MKKVIIITILLAILFSLIIYLNYKKSDKVIKYYEVYFLQYGAYSSPNSVSSITRNIDDYIVIKESDNLYHLYIGITKYLETANRIKVFYKDSGNNIYVRSKKISCNEFLDSYETLLNSANNISSIKQVESEIIKKYREYNCENIRDG